MKKENRLSAEDVKAIALRINAVFSEKKELINEGFTEEDAVKQLIKDMDEGVQNKWKHAIKINFAEAISPPSKRDVGGRQYES